MIARSVDRAIIAGSTVSYVNRWHRCRSLFPGLSPVSNLPTLQTVTPLCWLSHLAMVPLVDSHVLGRRCGWRGVLLSAPGLASVVKQPLVRVDEFLL